MPISSFLAPSALSKPGVCTSSTRPASPYEGQVIYETDTDKILAWTGSAWYAPWNTAWGLGNLTQGTSSVVIGATETATLTSPSFTAVANRYYRVKYFEPAINPPGGAGGYFFLRLRFTNASGTQIQQMQVQESGATSVANFGICEVIRTFTAGATVIAATAQASGAGGNLFRSSSQIAFLSVEDIGPA